MAHAASITVTGEQGDQWPLYLIAAEHSSRCVLTTCGRQLGRGTACYLAHGCTFCLRCATTRGREVAAHVAWARSARSRNG